MIDSYTKPAANGNGTPLESLRAAVAGAAAEMAVGAGAAGPEGQGPEGVTLERSPRVEFGDYSTNAALLLAPGVGAPPREVAEAFGAKLRERVNDIERFEVAGPGFVNLFLGDDWHRRALAAVLKAGASFGVGGAPRRERVLVEFVSANPTGPMHVGHARNAAYGDALARVLELHGHEVTREFYVNDAGAQVRKFGESIVAAAKGEEVPEDGYRGEYVERLAKQMGERAAGEAAEAGRDAVAAMVEGMKSSLTAFGVKEFDRWQYESELHEGDPSRVQKALKLLEEAGHTYRSEGAVWLRTTTFGDDKDRVVQRANGEYTYFASDIAYHEAKRERGYERQIDVWGADHHGYVGRMKAAHEALGTDGKLEMLIMQLVHLVRKGRREQMSKRSGEFVSLQELVEEIGVDAARWFLLSRSHDTTIDLDLDLAKEESNENPVYYVQYAHARIASVLAKAGGERVGAALKETAERAARSGAAEPAGAGAADESVKMHQTERALVKRLLAFPAEVWEASQRRAPHRIAAYALNTAQDFTAFYRDCRVVGAENEAVESQRIAVCVAAKTTIARCLEDLLGVNAPREM
jgi:arginyl-tRNA synthetase